MLLLNSVETFVFLTISPNSQINTQATYSYIPYVSTSREAMYQQRLNHLE